MTSGTSFQLRFNVWGRALSAEPIRAPSGAIAVGNTHRFFDRSQPPDEYRDEIVQRRVADGLSPMRSERALVVASIVYF